MRAKIVVDEYERIDIPDDTPVGAEFTLACTIRVVRVSEGWVDTSSYAGRETLPGERKAAVRITQAGTPAPSPA